MWNAKTQRRKERGVERKRAKEEGVFSAKVALAEVMGVFPRALPSFPRRRESGWYGRECESVGYDVGIPARPPVIPAPACRHSCACLPSFLRVPAVIPAWPAVIPVRGLPSFLRVPAVIPAWPAVIPVRGLPSFLCVACRHSRACLPSFPRRRESGWYGGECESVGYDVSVGMT